MTAPFPPVDGSQPCAQQDPDLFFPEFGGWGGASTIEAARVACSSCPFQHPCLDYALTTAVEGIWGATTFSERNRLREQRGITAEVITGLHDRDALADRRRAALRADGA